MQNLYRILLCAVGLLLGGCVSTPGGSVVPVPTAQTIAELVTPIVQGAVPLVLEKNPDYAPAIKTLAGGLAVAFGTGDLSPTTIGGTIATLNSRAQLGLDTATQTYLASALATGLQIYKQRFGVAVAQGTDPGVQLLLKAFADGLLLGVETWESVRRATAPAPLP